MLLGCTGCIFSLRFNRNQSEIPLHNLCKCRLLTELKLVTFIPDSDVNPQNRQFWLIHNWWDSPNGSPPSANWLADSAAPGTRRAADRGAAAAAAPGWEGGELAAPPENICRAAGAMLPILVPSYFYTQDPFRHTPK